jgi:prefoldin subunit 5
MDHITPLHQRKQELENAIEHKQVELDKARQEYRDFLATLRQLMEETV